MMLQPRKQTIVIHILSNISRSKGNETLKFGQLIKYNQKNIFLEKSYTKQVQCSNGPPGIKINKVKSQTSQK